MSTVQEHLKKLTMEQLGMALSEHCDGITTLTPDVALMVCVEIAARDPRKPEPYEAFRQFCRLYLP